jgi:hypothetical protein
MRKDEQRVYLYNLIQDEVYNDLDSDIPLQTGATKVTQAKVKHVASAVNTVGLKGAVTTASPGLVAEGDDTNVGIALTCKGTGAVRSSGGVQATKYEATATADGLTTGLIPIDASWVEVTSANPDHIVTLPALTAANAGMTIKIYVGANGCELRTPATSGATINGVDSDGTNELALGATTHYICEGTAADTWVVRGFTAAGADQAALVPDTA